MKEKESAIKRGFLFLALTRSAAETTCELYEDEGDRPKGTNRKERRDPLIAKKEMAQAGVLVLPLGRDEEFLGMAAQRVGQGIAGAAGCFGNAGGTLFWPRGVKPVSIEGPTLHLSEARFWRVSAREYPM